MKFPSEELAAMLSSLSRVPTLPEDQTILCLLLLPATLNRIPTPILNPISISYSYLSINVSAEVVVVAVEYYFSSSPSSEFS